MVGATTAFAVTQAPLGSPLFFVVAAVLAGCHLAILISVRHAAPDRKLLLMALGFAVACRVPLIAGPVNFDSDMIRYIWDGRVQRMGYNPYAVVPADAAVAHTHTADTVRMPSRFARTPYPPAAQLFFRAVVTISEAPWVMKIAFAIFDLLTMVLIRQWLRVTGRSEWLTLAYAWNPLVILEIAHSSHIDGLGAFWIAASACFLAGRRTAYAAAAFTMAVATKLVPIVLAPLFLGRVRPRDIALAAGLMALLYLPFVTDAVLPVGAVPNVVAHIRFNSPVFLPLASAIGPAGAAAVALAVGLGAAIWARLRLDASDPAAWAWPMALVLACAPVIYPWYLLYLTPFLFTRATLPLTVWTYTVIPVYIVWERAREGSRWFVPGPVMALEFGLVLAAVALLAAGRILDRRSGGREVTLKG